MGATPLHSDVRFFRDPDLPGVEARAASYRSDAFRTHIHDTFSVGLVLTGSTRFTLSGRCWAAQGGQLVVIEPGAPHACNPDNAAGIAYRMLYLAPAWLAGAAGGRAPRFPAPVLDDPELYAALAELFDAMAGGAPATDKQALLLACLRALVERHAAPGEDEAAAASPAVTALREELRANPGVFVPLDELAGRAGLSRHHFLRTFKAAAGLPPHAFQLHVAVEQAKALLAGGAPISQAALDAGFADQSHFSRCFREFTGATPGQWLAAEAGR